MQKKLTPGLVKNPLADAVVKAEFDEAVRGGRDRIFVWDEIEGFGLMVMTATRSQSYVVQYRHRGNTRRRSISNVLDLTAARKEAKGILGEAARGRDPIGEERKKALEAANTLESVFREYAARDGKKLRSIERQIRDMERLVLPKLGAQQIGGIRRLEVTRLLDAIEDECGPRMAQAVLAYLSKLFNWHAARDETFRSPLVRGMGRVAHGQGGRSRVLLDDELRAVWLASEASAHVFGVFVRFLLTTAVRRNEAAGMEWNELAGDDWIVPAARMKAKPNQARDHVVPLSSAARDVLKEIPRIGRYVFTTHGHSQIGGFSKFKARLDKASGVTGWTLHDCRRSARSLMSRAGVDPDTAERVLAHKLGGVRGIYDRYAYHKEKKQALEALAAQINRIVGQPSDVVVPIRRQA